MQRGIIGLTPLTLCRFFLDVRHKVDNGHLTLKRKSSTRLGFHAAGGFFIDAGGLGVSDDKVAGR